MDVDVNWYDPALQRWMNSISRQSTRYAYRNAWKTYVLFTGLQASDLITEAIEDQQRPILNDRTSSRSDFSTSIIGTSTKRQFIDEEVATRSLVKA